ncbi:glutamate decarboxylase and related PLP-dependent proteins [Candidatus Brocadia sinica JPN1]|uniref:Glutamate decarboxylase and related PLP-dependent proteins n=1 Tax=Candidatus Brocadia sinica JPN1 TaxID=1197129 RepID=A0ABQ0JVR5_9BACT|nr:glutamate decarboxylase and related PLP-dependent proteins [Candidatus Brocadia sinica JPN1]GIK13630.1 MAG: hypothetical protein BroJett002_23370 [Candidatus Brocadia sinica]GJQ16597.1 MAG: hypothetical protein HBSIN01_05560 [Candidatus Brocadia sinica]
MKRDRDVQCVKDVVYDGKDKCDENLGSQMSPKQYVSEGPDKKTESNKKYGIYSKASFRK